MDVGEEPSPGSVGSVSSQVSVVLEDRGLVVFVKFGFLYCDYVCFV